MIYSKKQVYNVVKKLIDNYVNEVQIAGINYHLCFNYIVDGKSYISSYDLPTINITNLDKFVEKLTVLTNKMASFHSDEQEYFEFDNDGFLEYLVLSSIVNMSEADFNSPLSYFDRLTNAYSYDYNLKNLKQIGHFFIKGEDVYVFEINGDNFATMESCAYKQFIFKSNGLSCMSPRINYYCVGDECYIMSIQSDPRAEKNELSKALDRYFRKVDKGLEDVPKSDGKVETIKDISPSFLVSLALFMASTSNEKYNFPSYIPIRYIHKISSLKYRNKSNLTEEDIDKIQTNITNKFLLTAARLCYHFDNSEYYMDNDGFLKMNFSDAHTHSDNIIYELYDSIFKSKKSKNK